MSTTNPTSLSSGGIQNNGIQGQRARSYNREQALAEQQRNQELQRQYQESVRIQNEAIARHNEIQRQEAENQYNNLVEKREQITRQTNKLNSAADKYNKLTEEFNNAKTTEEQDRVEQKLRAAAANYNELSRGLESMSGEYNAVLESAQQSGYVNADAKPLSYSSKEISVNIEKTAAEPDETKTAAYNKVKSAAEDIDYFSGVVSAKGEKYNSLVDQFNNAKTAAEQEEIKAQLELTAREYSGMSRKLEEYTNTYNAALKDAKAKNAVNQDAKTIDYAAQMLTPEYEQTEPQVSESIIPAAAEMPQEEQNFAPNSPNWFESIGNLGTAVVKDVGSFLDFAGKNLAEVPGNLIKTGESAVTAITEKFSSDIAATGDLIQYLNSMSSPAADKRAYGGGKDFIQAWDEGEPQALAGAAADLIKYAQKPEGMSEAEEQEWIEKYSIQNKISQGLTNAGATELGELIKPEANHEDKQLQRRNEAIGQFGADLKSSDSEFLQKLGDAATWVSADLEKTRNYQNKGLFSVNADIDTGEFGITINEPGVLFSAAAGVVVGAGAAAAAPEIAAAGGAGSLFYKGADLGIEGLTAAQAAGTGAAAGGGATATVTAGLTATDATVKAGALLATGGLAVSGLEKLADSSTVNLSRTAEKAQTASALELLAFPSEGGNPLADSGKFDEQLAKEKARKYKEQTGRDMVKWSDLDDNKTNAGELLKQATPSQNANVDLLGDAAATRIQNEDSTLNRLANISSTSLGTTFGTNFDFDYGEITPTNNDNEFGRRLITDDATRYRNANDDLNRTNNENGNEYRNENGNRYSYVFGFGFRFGDEFKPRRFPTIDIDWSSKRKKKTTSRKNRRGDYSLVTNRLRGTGDLLSGSSKNADMFGAGKTGKTTGRDLLGFSRR